MRIRGDLHRLGQPHARDVDLHDVDTAFIDQPLILGYRALLFARRDVLAGRGRHAAVADVVFRAQWLFDPEQPVRLE
jgi:hypothetical protein